MAFWNKPNEQDYLFFITKPLILEDFILRFSPQNHTLRVVDFN